MEKSSYLQKGQIFAVPALHYNMEMAAQVKLTFDLIRPDCIAVELPETMEEKILHAASRLPDISVILAYQTDHSPLYILSEPCDPFFEALRSGLEMGLPCHCIDLDVDVYPNNRDFLPDPYAVRHLGLKAYYELYLQSAKAAKQPPSLVDFNREMHMARRLKELCLRHEKVLYVCGMAHLDSVLNIVDQTSFPPIKQTEREVVQLCTLTPQSCREVLAEWGYLSEKYEHMRSQLIDTGTPDRLKIILNLYKDAAKAYTETTGNLFPGYHLRNIMKFVRNYALCSGGLMPNLYQILTAAQGCVDHNYAYESWEIATRFNFLRNVDSLPELDLSVEDIWGGSKMIHFHLREKGSKSSKTPKLRKDRSAFKFKPPHPFAICSYPPEDLAIEKFGNFLKKKGSQILMEEGSKVIPFSTSIEDGIDTKETIRHWHERKLFVKSQGKPPGDAGSVCIIFDEDKQDEANLITEKYPWRTTWLGEHSQESDMAFYATSLSKNIVGPGISRCEYGGFMMSYPPRRMQDVWFDPDYVNCRTKSEVLLMAAIDYAVRPLIVYVSASPPRSFFKSYAKRFGKKMIYIPIGQLSPITLNKLRSFHVLDGQDKRQIADEYII